MAKVQAFYDKNVPFGIVRQPSYYAYPISVSEVDIKRAEQARQILEDMTRLNATAGMPRQAQEMADIVAGKLRDMTKTKPQVKINVKREDTEQSD